MLIEDYENCKKNKKSIMCDKCSEHFYLEDVEIKTQTILNENKKEMMVHYFLCPKCREIFIVSIIDDKVRSYLSSLKIIDKKIKMMQNKGDVSLEYVSKRDFINSNLMRYEKALKNKYSKYFYLV